MLTRRIATLSIAVACVSACGGDGAASAPTPAAPAGPATVDLRQGTYRGAGIGDRRREVARVLGEGTAGRDELLAPLGRRDGLSLGQPPTPRSPSGVRGAPSTWRFDGAAMLARGGRAWLAVFAAGDARTREGVGVGSALADVRAAYPRARCGTANEGTEYVQLPYCTAQVAVGRHVWFGADPVRSITVSRAPLG